jgi:hypothetical protein
MITFLRNLVFEDFWLKLFSLGLAILTWFTVTFVSPKDVRTDKRVFSNLPVTILASAEDVHSFKVSPTEVEVTVQGDAKTVQNLRQRHPGNRGSDRGRGRPRIAQAHRGVASRWRYPHACGTK